MWLGTFRVDRECWRQEHQYRDLYTSTCTCTCIYNVHVHVQCTCIYMHIQTGMYMYKSIESLSTYTTCTCMYTNCLTYRISTSNLRVKVCVRSKKNMLLLEKMIIHVYTQWDEIPTYMYIWVPVTMVYTMYG